MLPGDIKLSFHAAQRLRERDTTNTKYNTKNLIRSTVKWYNRDDFMPHSEFESHILYVCRKKKRMRYITDGNVEVLYDRETRTAITVMAVKDKFKPITQYLKPDRLSKKEGVETDEPRLQQG